MELRKTSLIFAAGLLFMLVACSEKQVHLNPAMSVPAATATAKVSHDDNGNTVVDLKVKHLARPENLTPSRATYVVWIQPPGSPAVKQGELRVNDNLEAEFKTPTTYQTFLLFVTAEDSAAVTRPSGQEVLRQEISG